MFFTVNNGYYRISSVRLDTIEEVKRFVNFILKYSEEYYLMSGRYLVNAKSIMGIFSLDLSKSIDLISEQKVSEEFLKDFKEQNFKKE
jgi:phosphotransferase system HPr-like phosphotransfer protein